MDHFEVEVGEVNQPSCLPTVECLGLPDVGEIFVVSKDLDQERGAMRVMLPRFQSMKDGKEFAIINVIVSFCRGERLGEVRARVPIAIGIGLEENGARCVLRGVSGDSKGG